MDITIGFLTYATLFRLAIIGVGAASIYLGYRLFVHDPIGKGKTTAIAEGGGFKLTLRNFWPGVYFAGFGTVIIGIMLWQGSPELMMKELTSTRPSANAETRIVETAIRGNGSQDEIDRYWKALSDPTLRLARAAEPIHRIAAVWHGAQRKGEALAMARLAVRIEPENPDYLALFARLLMDNEQPDKALPVMEAAARLDGRYAGELSKVFSSESV